MNLKIYNTLTGKKEDFKPLNPPLVKMYVCGPTVYDLLHVGNFRGPVVFNLIRNYLELIGYNVQFALNFTDIEDKIIKKAIELKISASEVSEKYIAEYKKDFSLLGLRPHDFNPKVTEHLESIISITEKLIENGTAYLQNGDVLYSIEKFPNYGQLSGRNPEELIAGARVDVDEKKKNPLDFVLWKSAKAGEPSWSSPWGPGRPGWHIECSAMIYKIFGEQIDIHGGGSDLMFPHHENELAQTEGCTHKQFVKYWVHWQMLNFSGQKMSKSLGNIMSLRDFVEKYHPEIYKFMMLFVHYRSVAEFNEDSINRSISSLAKVYSSLSLAEDYFDQADAVKQLTPVMIDFKNTIEKIDKKDFKTFHSLSKQMDSLKLNSEYQVLWDKITLSLSDDFNTSEVLAVIYESIKIFNQTVKIGMKLNPNLVEKSFQLKKFFSYVGFMMSIFNESPKEFLKYLDQRLIEINKIDIEVVKKLIEERKQARTIKDFKKSDEIRDQLNSMGIAVSDTPSGMLWEVLK